MRGPFAAVVLSMWRLQWSFTSCSDITTDAGEHISFVLDSPAAIATSLYASVSRWRARRIELELPHLHSTGFGPVRHGIASILRSPSKTSSSVAVWDKSCVAPLRSAIVNGQWPQARLYSSGLSESIEC